MARVELSTPGPQDEADFIAAMTASADVHRPWLYPPVTSQAYREYLARLIPDRKHGFLARRVEDRALVGWLNVSDIVRGALQGANVSYGGVAAHRGQGYMSEALDLVLHEAFVTLGLHRLEANIQPGNVGSLTLVRRAGFQLEGFSPGYLEIDGDWRDHERWALRAEAWIARRR